MNKSKSNDAQPSVSKLLGKVWWIPLIRGCLMIILGAYALFQPGMTMSVLVQVIGVLLFAEGVLSIISAVMEKIPSRFWTIIRGVLFVLGGLFVFTHSAIVADVSTTFIVYMFAVIVVLAGVFEIIGATHDHKDNKSDFWPILGGILAILFGILLFCAPVAFGTLFMRILGVFAIINGISLVILAFRIRHFAAALEKHEKKVES